MKKLVLAEKCITTDLPSFIMGIVNCTPDSFYAPSRCLERSTDGSADDAVFTHIQKLISEGADILDVGGESTRPGASYVSAEEEISRIVPVIEKIRKESDICISVDTRKKEVMEAAFNAGADMLNDISALEDDDSLGAFISFHKLPVILMHKRGKPDIMQKNTAYGDVFSEVDEYLQQRISYALQLGIQSDRIIIDPGIGFGKNLEANEVLISQCGKLCGGKYPVLMALSRKSCIGEMTGRPVEERLFGTIAADLVAVQSGASILRVHDVAACRDSLNVLSSLENSGGVS
jgi:dihydropteroate synthase